MRTKKDSHKQGSPCVSSSPLQCFEPVTPAYNQSRLYGWLKLRASTYNQLWISMPAVLVTVPTITQNSLQPLSTSSTTARHPLDFMVQGKITEADAPTILLDATPSGLSVPPLLSLPFLCRMPFLLQPSQFIPAWDRQRIMPACIPGGLVCARSKYGKIHINLPHRTKK